jgi:hypothetical protein
MLVALVFELFCTTPSKNEPFTQVKSLIWHVNTIRRTPSSENFCRGFSRMKFEIFLENHPIQPPLLAAEVLADVLYN